VDIARTSKWKAVHQWLLEIWMPPKSSCQLLYFGQWYIMGCLDKLCIFHLSENRSRHEVYPHNPQFLQLAFCKEANGRKAVLTEFPCDSLMFMPCSQEKGNICVQ
jgi:hypothetical protein